MIGFNECELSVVEDSEASGISVQLLHGSLEGSVEVLVTPLDRTARSKLYCVSKSVEHSEGTAIYSVNVILDQCSLATMLS